MVESSSAEHALQVIEDLSGIDLLLTAVGLPMMSGRRLAAAVLAAGYTMPVLFISGHPPEGTLPAHFIQKPFTRDELWAKVREVLAPVPAGGTPQG